MQGGEAYLSGGSTVSSNNYAICNGYGDDENSRVEISGCTLIGGSGAFENRKGQTVTASGTQFTSGRMTVIVNRGSFTADENCSIIGKDGAPGRVAGSAAAEIGCEFAKAAIWEDYANDLFLDSIPSEHLEADDSAKTVSIKTEEGLAWWADQINRGADYSGYTITLEKDMNMSGHVWRPVDAQNALSGAVLNGGGHAISNLTVRGGSPSVDAGGLCGTGFLGALGGFGTDLENLSFLNADVANSSNGGGQQIGVVVGMNACEGLTLRNVAVNGAIVTGFGQVGGLIGQTGCRTTVDHCTVRAETLIGSVNTSGLIGRIRRTDDLTLTESDAEASWTPASPKSAFFCYNGTADRFYDIAGEKAGEKLPDSVSVTGIYYRQENGQLTPAWNLTFSDYEPADGCWYCASDGKGSELCLQGRCFASFAHTGYDDWAVISEPGDGVPGVERGDCDMDICGLTCDRYFWNVTIHPYNGDENVTTRHIFSDRNEPTAFAEPETPERTDYTFVGWYADENCSERFDFTKPITADTDIYAGWKKNTSSITITKTNTADAAETFVYTIEGEGLSLTVFVQGNGSVTVTNLPVGSYTVTELSSWSWSFDGAGSQQILLTVDGAELVFANGEQNDNWLTGSAAGG